MIRRFKRAMLAAAAGIMAFTAIPDKALAETDYKGFKLPFELTAPENVAVSWMEGNDSENTCTMSYSMNDSMNEWMVKMADPNSHDEMCEKLVNEYKMSDLWVEYQVDWAIDDPENGWHYNEYWDNKGLDKDYHSHVGEWDYIDLGIGSTDKVNDVWLFRGRAINIDPDDDEEVKKSENEWWFGNEFIPGLKNQLKEDQYTLVENEDKTEQYVKIDFARHTVYVRARYVATVRTDDADDVFIFSDWSNIASCGKDEEKYEPLTKDTLKAPDISDIAYYKDDFNGWPQITCKLVVPEDLTTALTKMQAVGGYMSIEWEARVPDGKWVGLQGDWTLKTGDLIIALQNLGEALSEGTDSETKTVLEKGSPVELRARYFCKQYEKLNGEELEDLYSDYTVLTFGTEELVKPEQEPVKEEEPAKEEEPQKEEKKVEKKEKEEDDKCGLCGFCPQPLGICIFIWIAIIIAIVIIVIVVLKLKGDSSDKEKKK